MTIDEYVAELQAALHVRGGVRRRFLHECRDHLRDSTDERGENDAVRAFGPATTMAAAFDAEVAATRGLRSTVLSVTAVVATGGSTLALINTSSAETAAPTFWAGLFFIAAQFSAVAMVLAALQALVVRRAGASPAELMLLGRRNACALIAAGGTMFAAGAAVPGQGDAILLLIGPLLAIIGFGSVVRARALTRRLDGARTRVARAPLSDLAEISGLPLASVTVIQLLPVTVALAASAAFIRDHADEHATVQGALVIASVEGIAVIACLLIFGRVLGLRRAGLTRLARRPG